ncbi:uncharacterized protein LOC144101655 [Amblyomma americanum]
MVNQECACNEEELYEMIEKVAAKQVAIRLCSFRVFLRVTSTRLYRPPFLFWNINRVGPVVNRFTNTWLLVATPNTLLLWDLEIPDRMFPVSMDSSSVSIAARTS